MKALREFLRWWELRRRLKKCKTPAELTKVRRSHGQKYRTKKPRDMETESKQASLRG